MAIRGTRCTPDHPLLAGKDDAPPCRIPHLAVKAEGVHLTTTCSEQALRLTRDHLVFQPGGGLVRADSLGVGDVLLADFEGRRECVVTAAASETDQLYFGLNWWVGAVGGAEGRPTALICCVTKNDICDEKKQKKLALGVK